MSWITPATETEFCVVVSPASGQSIVMIGGVVSSVSCMLEVPILFAPLEATAVMLFLPSLSSSSMFQLPSSSVAGFPFTVTEVVASSVVPETVMFFVFSVLRFWGVVISISSGLFNST